jgi:hypothetical protein
MRMKDIAAIYQAGGVSNNSLMGGVKTPCGEAISFNGFYRTNRNI